MKLAPVLLCLAIGATPLPAQRLLDPDKCLTCWDSVEHFGAGAVLDGAARGVFPRWKAWQRILLTGGLIGAVWEAGQTDIAYHQGLSGRPGYGFGIKDWACDVLGAVFAEAVWSLAKRL